MDYATNKTPAILILLFICFSFLSNIAGQTSNILVETNSLVHGQDKKLSIFVKEHIEKILIAQPNVTIVDRDFFSTTEKEREVQKNESFMEGYYVKQGKSLGASLIFKVGYDDRSYELKITCLDVSTNRKVFFESYKIKRFLINYQIERPRYFGRYIEEITMEIVKELNLDFNLSTKIIEISKTKKNKAVEVVIYCDNNCGFRKDEKLSLYTSSKQAKNATYMRSVKIGEIKITFVESKQIAIAKVKSGHKEILASFNEGNTINCRYD